MILRRWVSGMVSIGHTLLWFSENRMFNINVGVSKFNGVVIARRNIFV
jgi:hypothetical protein